MLLKGSPDAQKKKTGGIGNQRKNQGHPGHGIVKMDKNTGELRRPAVSETRVKEHPLWQV